MAVSSFPPQGGGTDFFALTPNLIKYENTNLGLVAGASADLVTINGAGLLLNLKAKFGNVAQVQYIGLQLIVDGVTYDLMINNGGQARFVAAAIANAPYFAETTSGPIAGFEMDFFVAFKSSLIIRARNFHGTSSATTMTCYINGICLMKS